MVEGIRQLTGEAEDYPQGTPIRSLLEQPAKQIDRFREKANSLPNPEQFIIQERQILEQKGFTDSNVEFPSRESLVEAFEVWHRAVELGFTEIQAHILPGKEFTRDTNYPRGWVRLNDWYWQQIGKSIAPDAAVLRSAFVLFDTTPKPNYDGGRQLYPNDQFGPLMSYLRQQGTIEVPSSYKHVHQTSRFSVTPVEREYSFDPAFAQILCVDASKVRIPTAVENNFLGNMHYQYLGETNTWEWFDDKFEGDRRLIGGSSDFGGLAYVDDYWRDYRNDRIGFRPLVVFSS